MKKFCINGQLRSKLFLIVIHSMKGLSEDGGRADFLKTYRASLFNEDLSNEPNFGRIHLAGQYLKEELKRKQKINNFSQMQNF